MNRAAEARDDGGAATRRVSMRRGAGVGRRGCETGETQGWGARTICEQKAWVKRREGA